MKKFIRTIPGKAILFLGVIVSLCILAGCVLGADAIADAGFYDYPEEMVISSRMEEMVREDINSMAWEIYDSDSFNFVHSCSILFPNFLKSNDPIAAPIVLFNTSSSSQ